MTLVAAVGYGTEVRLISDTTLTIGSSSANIGSKLYKINDHLAIGMAGVGAYAHHLIGDVLSYLHYKNTTTDKLFDELMKSNIDKKIVALSQIDPKYASQVSFLAAGLDEEGLIDIRKFYVEKDLTLKEMIMPFNSINNQSYKLAAIGSGDIFRGDLKRKIESDLMEHPNLFPDGYREVVQAIIDTPYFSSVGGHRREISICKEKGFSVRHDLTSYSRIAVAGKGFGVQDFKPTIFGKDLYTRRMIELITYLKHTKNDGHGWIQMLREQKVTDQTLIDLIPQFAVHLQSWHPGHRDHAKTVEMFIRDAQKNL